MRLWDFALAAWDRPGVSEICLRLQDRYGQCVPLLLWRAWLSAEGREPGGDLARNAVALAKAQEAEIIAPLREARRAAHPDVAEAARGAEIAAEEALLNALEDLTQGPSARTLDSGDGPARALTDLCLAWNGRQAGSTARALAARLR